MKLKNLMLFFLIFFCLILSVSAISATDDVNITDTQSDDTSLNETIVKDVNSSAEKISSEKTSAPVKKTQKKIKTDVDADVVYCNYKKNNYFKVKVKNDKTDKHIKNLKLNVKIFTGSKSKTYTIKTNSKGIAKFNTKHLKIGSHKVIISSANDKYKVSKKSKIIIAKMKTATIKINSKKLTSKDKKVKVYIKKKHDENEVKFKSVKKTKVIKAIFYFKNKRTGKIVVKYDSGEFDDGKWELPDEDYSPYKYTPIKVKVWYI